MNEQKVEVVTEEKKGMSTLKKGLIGIGGVIGLGVVGLLLHRSKDKPVECEMADSYVAPTSNVTEFKPEE